MTHTDRSLSRYELQTDGPAVAVTCRECDVVVFGHVGESLPPVGLDVLVEAARRHETEVDERAASERQGLTASQWWSVFRDSGVRLTEGGDLTTTTPPPAGDG